MIKLLGLEDFGTWLRKGKEVIVNNNLGLLVVKRGYAKTIGYVDIKDKRAIGKKEMERRFKLLKKYQIPVRPNYSFGFMVDFLEQLEGGFG